MNLMFFCMKGFHAIIYHLQCLTYLDWVIKISNEQEELVSAVEVWTSSSTHPSGFVQPSGWTRTVCRYVPIRGRVQCRLAPVQTRLPLLCNTVSVGNVIAQNRENGYKLYWRTYDNVFFAKCVRDNIVCATTMVTYTRTGLSLVKSLVFWFITCKCTIS